MEYPKVIVLCTNSEGAPEFYTCAPEVTQAQIDNGEHYDLAKENAEHNGYTGPMLAFDVSDPAAKQFESLLSWVSGSSPTTPSDFYVIYSSNESAINDGAGFWSNAHGWVDQESATRFSHAESKTFNMPLSTGKDARWMLVEGNFQGASSLIGEDALDILRGENDRLKQYLRDEGERIAELRCAIEAMRVAGGSVEFQMAFDRAKELIVTPGA